MQQYRRAAMLAALAVVAGIAAAQPGQAVPTWQVQSDYRGTRDVVSQPRSLRGLALSADGSSLYGGFIQGTSSSSLRKVSSAIIPGTITPGSVHIQAEVELQPAQPKGVATDDRGYVYVTLNNFNGSTNLQFQIFSSDLGTVVSTTTSLSPAAQLGGISAQKVGSDYYVYLARNRGAATIERWIVTNPAAPVLDTTWATSGRVDLKTLNSNAYCNGLEVDTDGTIYCAGGLLATTRGDTLFKIAADGSTVTSTSVSGAMDVALFQGKAYVTQYLASNSAIAVLNMSNLSLVETLTPGFPRPYNLDTDNGYAGIDISADGKIYVADQIYDLTPPRRTYYDRILVSDAVADLVPPDITCPPDIEVGNDPGECYATVDPGTATAVDNIDGPIPVTGVRSDGEPLDAPYPIGVTTIIWTATDNAGNSDDCPQTITVLDVEPPTVSVTTAVTELWPANHDLVDVGLQVNADDNCPEDLTVSIQVFSNEDDLEPKGSGNFSPDAKDTGALRLRAERSGNGDGRVYLILVKATDGAGHVTVRCATVTVPKSQSAKSLAALNAAASAAKTSAQTSGSPPSGFVLVGDGPAVGPKQ